MKIISRIRNIISKGPKYRFSSHIDFYRCREEIASAINDFGNRDSVECNALKELKLHVSIFNIVDKRIKKEWKLSNFNIEDKRIKVHSHNTNLLPHKPKSSFGHFKQGIQEFHRRYVLVPAGKAANNIVVVCRLHYINTLKQELNDTKAYEETSTDEKTVVNSH